ncbi:hypothetical protein LR48_Vigan263s001200 [Vigna angularis]|uniref:Uncharacterized protein n=1 Tax=Phaseolus angularis TaxID=3914 RepID=A0A0L9T8G9_PHAAN|nr:hypothetical protein LR48_Vigan263s001200 [Vigna angularis]
MQLKQFTGTPETIAQVKLTRIGSRSVQYVALGAGNVLTVLKRERRREWTFVHSLAATRLPLTFWNVPKMTSDRRMQEYVRVVNGTEYVSRALMEAEW